MDVNIGFKGLNAPRSATRGGTGEYSLISPIQGCATGQGMVFGLSVLNRV